MYMYNQLSPFFFFFGVQTTNGDMEMESDSDSDQEKMFHVPVRIFFFFWLSSPIRSCKVLTVFSICDYCLCVYISEWRLFGLG